MKVYLIHPKDDPGWLVVTDWDEVLDYIDGDEEEEWLVKVVEMTEEDLRTLPEFEGW